MSYTARTDYCCSVNTEKEYTSFKWSLPDFSLLKEYYKKVFSSEFIITNTDAKCHLEFVLQSNDSKADYGNATPTYGGTFGISSKSTAAMSQPDEYAYVSLHFPPILESNKLKVIMSIIDGTGAKTLTLSQTKKKTDPKMTFKIIDTSTLMNPLMSAGYMINDTLTILCEIINIKDQHSVLTDSKKHVEHFSNEVQKKLQIFFDKKSFCDVIFTIDDTEFHGHRVILAANSPVFEAMFSTDMSENTEKNVKIKDIDVATFEAFLKYMYTGSVAKMDDIVGDLLIVADKYQVQSLRNLCETYIADHLDKANAIEYLLLAYLHNFETLKSKALLFVRACQQEIVDSMEFKKLCTHPDLVSEIFRKPC